MNPSMPPDGPSPTAAGFVARTVAFVIDLFTMGFIAAVTAEAVILLSDFFRIGKLAFVHRLVAVISSIIVALVILCYLPISWTVTRRSLGKAIMGLRIETTDGRDLKIGRSFLRLAGYWLSALPLGLGFLWPIFDPKRRGLHDVLARTRVVYEPRHSH
jgi:uncharacterized RDD family membrane protein YckC